MPRTMCDRDSKRQLVMSQSLQLEVSEERDRLRESLSVMQDKFIDLQHHEREVVIYRCMSLRCM